MMRAPDKGRWVLLLSAFTLVAFGGLGAWLMAGVQHRPPHDLLGAAPVPQGLVAGMVLGLATAAGALILLAQPLLRPVALRYAALVGPFVPRRWHRVLLSLAAGVGEELLFRGALQHWLGVPLTSILFVALHGYLDPRDGRLSLYGLYLVVCMLAFGTLGDTMGLWPVMLAHAVFDIILLERLRRWHTMR